MTFFANAGLKWPKFEDQSRDAGQTAMSAASDIWRLFSILEGIKESPADRPWELKDLQDKSAADLRRASKTYANMAASIGAEYVRPLSSAEFEVAALAPEFQDNAFAFGFRASRFHDELQPRRSYQALADWLSAIADQIEALDLTQGQMQKLSSQVFRIMRRWEVASNLARAIAVLNRRQPGQD